MVGDAFPSRGFVQPKQVRFSIWSSCDKSDYSTSP